MDRWFLLQVYVVTSYFNLIRQIMSGFFPLAVGLAAEMIVSVQRIQVYTFGGKHCVIKL